MKAVPHSNNEEISARKQKFDSTEPLPQCTIEYLEFKGNHSNINYINTLKYTLINFIRFLKDHSLYDKDFENFDFTKIDTTHIAKYKDYLLENNSPFTAKNRFTIVKSFFKFLGKEEMFPEISYSKVSNTCRPDAVNKFIKYLGEVKLYSQLETYQKHLDIFLKFIKVNYPELYVENEIDFREVELSLINSYETHQLTRVLNKRITRMYAYNLLRSVSLFFQYLKKNKLSFTLYTPPRNMQREQKRSNEYVEIIDIEILATSIFNPTPRNINVAYRDFAIFLILVNTGCRPLEIANLKLEDIWKTESTILLKSKKSGQRKLKLNKTVFEYLNKYLDYRETFKPKNNSLFLKLNGKAIDSHYISNIFYNINQKVYSQSRYTAKSLRHTFITNALENTNDMKKVAEIAGHKYLVSTDYYRHRSFKRLVKNTKDHDPTAKFEKEFEYGITCGNV